MPHPKLTFRIFKLYQPHIFNIVPFDVKVTVVKMLIVLLLHTSNDECVTKISF